MRDEVMHGLNSLDSLLSRLIRLLLFLSVQPIYSTGQHFALNMASFFSRISQPLSDKLSMLIEAILTGLVFWLQI